MAVLQISTESFTKSGGSAPVYISRPGQSNLPFSPGRRSKKRVVFRLNCG
jgi:hypothetical protein